jgi:hypothetical protein
VNLMGRVIPLRWAVKFRIQLNVRPTSVSSALCKRNESIIRDGKEYRKKLELQPYKAAVVKCPLQLRDPVARPHLRNWYRPLGHNRELDPKFTFFRQWLALDRLCGLMVRSRGPGSIPGATKFSE